MQTVVNNHHFELICIAYFGYSFSITKKKYMKGQNYSYLMNICLSHEVLVSNKILGISSLFSKHITLPHNTEIMSS